MNPAASSRRRVLVVDDHAFMQEGVKAIIEREPDFEAVGVASNGGEALSYLASKDVDLLVLDIGLGGEDGLDLVRQVTTRWPDVGIVALSLHDEKLYAERALRAGARAYVMKSEDPPTLVEALRRVAKGGVYLSPAMQSVVAARLFYGGDEPEASSIAKLTDRELAVFRMLGEGRSSREIAAALNVGFKTVQTYRERIKVKLNLTTARELMRRAVLHVEESIRSREQEDT